jgi:hypothetical protein
VHVFKTPSPPAYAQPGTVKTDYSPNRSPSSMGWKQSSYPSPTRPDPSRKPSFGQATTDYFGDQGNELDRALDVARSKSQKPYSIYPGAIPDTYIYERSISSMSDLPGSPGSSSSSDTESIDTPIEVCSIRARSSVETLEATLSVAQNNQISPVGPSPYGTAFLPPPTKGRPLVVPPDPRFPPRAAVADDDDSTVVSDEPQQLTRIGGPVALPPVYPVVPSTTPLVVPPLVPVPPVRRNSDERRAQAPPPLTRRESSQAPPPLTRRDSAQAPPPLTRRDSSQPSSRTTSPSGSGPNVPPGLQYPMAPSMSRRPSTSPQRSPSGEQPSPPRILTTSQEGTTQKRSVRWTEDLVCPSPILPSQRRRGWYNRRG